MASSNESFGCEGRWLVAHGEKGWLSVRMHSLAAYDCSDTMNHAHMFATLLQRFGRTVVNGMKTRSHV